MKLWDALSDLNLPGSALAVLIAILSYAEDDKVQSIEVSQQDLAIKSGLSIRTIHEHLHVLETHDLIINHTYAGKKSRSNVINKYELTDKSRLLVKLGMEHGS